jgi:CPA1 family monovalent cation:H+ antiporter
MNPHTLIEFLLLLLIAASVIAVVTSRFKVPYTVFLVFGGVLIDLFRVPIVDKVGGAMGNLLSPDVVFMVFLPGLLFEAGINIHIRHLRATCIPILLLALAGILTAAFIAAYLVHWAIGIPLQAALVFGVLIAATDPISVLMLFKEVGAPKRLSVIIEGESLFNDGTAVVVFQILVASIAGGALSLGDGVVRFLVVVLGGGVLGVILGYVTSKLTERIDEPRVEIMLTTVLAYGSFLLAEQLHVSGVIATVGAGLMIGNFGAETGMSSRTRVALWSFWEYWGFVINSIVFLIIGIEVHIFDLIGHGTAIGISVVAVLLGRMAAVYLLIPLGNALSEPISWAWRHVLVWGGIHGSVSLALVLTLPNDFPARDLVLAMTFGVVAFSIIVQGLTVKPLMHKLGINTSQENEYDHVRVQRMALTAGLKDLEQLHAEHLISGPVFEELSGEITNRIGEVREQVENLHVQHPELVAKEMQAARKHMILSEKGAIQKALGEGWISPHTAETMLAKADDEALGDPQDPEGAG